VHVVIFAELERALNGQEGHVPLEPVRGVIPANERRPQGFEGEFLYHSKSLRTPGRHSVIQRSKQGRWVLSGVGKREAIE
jgi:hypothetical protein